MGRGTGRILTVLLAVSSLSCGASATPAEEPVADAPAPAEEPAPPGAEAQAAGELPVHDCGQDPAGEEPVARGTLGEGNRVVRIINNSGGDVQARLLDRALAPVLPGTLRIAEGETGEFRVPAGSYYLRYRHESCQVRRGALLELTGARAGVEIAIRPHFNKGSSSKMRVVKEPL